MTRYLFTFLICCASSAFEARGQFRLQPRERLHMSADSILRFIGENQIEYGFLAWESNSGWLTMEDQLYGLLRQNGRWYLAEFISRAFPGDPERKAVYVRQKAVEKRRADALLGV